MIGRDFSLSGIALGTIVVIVGYHLAQRAISDRTGAGIGSDGSGGPAGPVPETGRPG